MFQCTPYIFNLVVVGFHSHTSLLAMQHRAQLHFKSQHCSQHGIGSFPQVLKKRFEWQLAGSATENHCAAHEITLTTFLIGKRLQNSLAWP